MKRIKLFEEYINEKKSKLRGWTRNYYQAAAEVKRWTSALEGTTDQVAFLNSLDCAKDPNESFTQVVGQMLKNALAHQKKTLKRKQGMLKKLQVEFKSKAINAEPGAAEAMKIATATASIAPGSKLIHDDSLEVWKGFELTNSDLKKCEKYVADYQKKYEAAKSAFEPAEDKFYDYLENKIK